MFRNISRRSFLRLAAAMAAGRLCVAATPRRRWLLGSNTAIEGYGLLQAIQTVRDLGFPAIEIHPMGIPEPQPGKFPGFQFDQLDQQERKEIRQSLRGFSRITTHLPYAGLDYMSESRDRRESSIHTIETAMEATHFFGGNLAVLHPQALPAERLEKEWDSYLQRFRVWGDRARRLGFRLALETGYPGSISDFVRLIQSINHEWVGATIDVGHQGKYAELVARVRPEDKGTPKGIKAYNDTTLDIIGRLGVKVFHLHVHDIEPATWREHQPLVHGFVDYPRLFRKLRDIDYQGILMFEIGGAGSDMPGYLKDAKKKLSQLM